MELTSPEAPASRRSVSKAAEFASTLKEGAHLQFAGELRMGEYQKEHRSYK